MGLLPPPVRGRLALCGRHLGSAAPPGLAHPFVRGLTDGSLRREAFRFYAVQDALYLRDFARALSIAAARAPRDEWIIMFNEHAAGALKVERSLHESFFAEWGLTPEAGAATA